MKYALLLITLLFLSVQTRAQETVYPPDSLTTKPAIPRDAVKIPTGRPSGPSARLGYAVYKNIRFPRTALSTRTGGKVIVYGVIDASGVFVRDSAGLFEERAVMVIGDESAKVETQDVCIGYVKDFTLKKKKWSVADAPKKWSKAQKDIVLEAIRVTGELPTFKPGTLRGQKVASYIEIPVVFRHGLDSW